MGKYRELRNEWNRLMRDAHALANVAREATEKQVGIVRELNALSVRFENAREEFWKETLEEVEREGGKVKVKELKLDDPPTPEPATPMGRYMPEGTGRLMKANPLPEGLEPVYVAAASGARKCSLCRNLDPVTKLPVKGHRAQNCPFAHVIQQQKKEAAAQPKQKRQRKPLSPERKAQLAKTLEKARAARKEKKK